MMPAVATSELVSTVARGRVEGAGTSLGAMVCWQYVARSSSVHITWCGGEEPREKAHAEGGWGRVGLVPGLGKWGICWGVSWGGWAHRSWRWAFQGERVLHA